MIKVENLKKSFGDVEVLKGISLEVKASEHCVIMGPSGSGKSTLLHLIAGLDRGDFGDIFVDGENISRFNDELLANYRNRTIGLMFQFHYLLSSMNCLQNILLPGNIGGVVDSHLKSFVSDLAIELGVTHCLSKFPYELSGGEQQRVNLIRALSLRPKVLLCDEPTGNLDSANSKKVVDLLKRLAAEFDLTLLVVTHDEQVANCFPRKVSIEDGILSKHHSF